MRILIRETTATKTYVLMATLPFSSFKKEVDRVIIGTCRGKGKATNRVGQIV